jgi:hypothetical protein
MLDVGLDFLIACSAKGMDQSEARGSFGKVSDGKLFVEMIKALSVKFIVQLCLQRIGKARIAEDHNH